MKKEEIDKLITESLSKDEAEFYKNLDNEGPIDMLKGVYTGKLTWVMVLTSLVHIAAFAIAIYFGYKLFVAESTAEMVQYGSIMFIALLFASMIKIMHWMQMYKNSVVREMKRLEYQIAALMEKL